MKSAIEIIKDSESMLEFNDDGGLEFDGLDLNKLVSNGCMTPMFIFSQHKLKAQVDKLKEVFSNAFGEFALHYVIKTNDNKAVLETLAAKRCNFMINSFSELAKLFAFKNDNSKLIFNHPALTQKEVQRIVDEKIGLVVVDSISQLRLMDKVAKSNNAVINVLLRINTGVEGETSYSASETMMGITMEELEKNLADIQTLNNVKIKGIHNHLTSQNTDKDLWKQNIKRIYEFTLKINRELGIEYLDLGGGFPIKYDENMLSLQDIANIIGEPIRKLKKKIPQLKIFLEPGRFLVGPAMVLLSKVRVVKNNKVLVMDTSTYDCSMDSIAFGINLPVTSTKRPSDKYKKYLIRGSTICTSDVLRKEAILNEVNEGECLVFLNAGAYMIGTDLFSNERPPVSVIKNNK
jgi:diaminopimelate decarboxylase